MAEVWEVDMEPEALTESTAEATEVIKDTVGTDPPEVMAAITEEVTTAETDILLTAEVITAADTPVIPVTISTVLTVKATAVVLMAEVATEEVVTAEALMAEVATEEALTGEADIREGTRVATGWGCTAGVTEVWVEVADTEVTLLTGVLPVTVDQAGTEDGEAQLEVVEEDIREVTGAVMAGTINEN